MAKPNPPPWTLRDYERAAAEYLRSLPPEHFMEATPKATQREISLASLALLKSMRGSIQVCNELLVQYFWKGKLRQVVPDNMVLDSDQPVQAVGSFNVELEPAGPFWVLEYISKSSRRKDYKDSFRKYQRELRVPYRLLFYPERQDLRLYRHDGQRYVRVEANLAGRLAIPELNLELGLLNGSVRFWYSGRLLELPGDLQQRFEQLQARIELERQRANQAEQMADRERQRAEREKRRAQRERQRAERESQRAEHERQRAERERTEPQRARQEFQEERKRRLTAEAELARLRALLAQQPDKPVAGPDRPRNGR
jgi:Uma2 family endonuclease